MIKVNKLFFTVLVSAVLAACGGGDSLPVTTTTSTSNVTAAVSSSTAAAVVNQPFTFAAGVPDFGTTTPTTVTFTSATATPAFAISADGFTASGPTTFGSCIYTVTSSTFPAGSKLAVGQSVRVNPCNLNVATAGGNANGAPADREVKFVLGSVNSNGKNLAVVINANGSVVINSITIGTVTISIVTGA